MKTRHLPLLALMLLAPAFLFSQTTNIQQATSVNTDGTAPDASAILDVQATDKGMLTPRMTTTQRTAIASPAAGLLVYDTDTGSFWFFEYNAWNEIPTISNPPTFGTNGTAMAIPDCTPSGITSTIALTDPGTVTADMQFKVCLDITHPLTDNLDISLEAPDGTSIDLSSDNGGSDSNYTGTCFTTESTNPITSGSAPFTGNWQPEEPFSNFIGKAITGDWKLKVVDDGCLGFGDTGQLDNWSIKIALPSVAATLISDADGDTKVTVEDFPDEDVIRFEAGDITGLLITPDSSMFQNRVRVNGSFVSGGGSNTASGNRSFVGGGDSNTASGSRSFVGGGFGNSASGSSSFVGGGNFNDATSSWSSIVGGTNNTASGNRSFVGGGNGLTAESYSEAVFGTYNTDYTPTSTTGFNAADRLFVIGNGTNGGNRSNAVTVLKSGNVGIGTDSPDARLDIEGGALLVQGIAGGTPVSGAGTRLMWIPEKKAFRSGEVTGAQWDDSNIGNRSFAGGGQNNRASGTNSFVGGGESNEIVGGNSFIGGGTSNTIGNFNSFVGGGQDHSIAGLNTFIGGGKGLVTNSIYEAVFGSYNTDYTPQSTTSFNPADRLFIIGNGTSSGSRSDAVTVLKSGNVGIGTASPTGKLDIQADNNDTDTLLAFSEGTFPSFFFEAGFAGTGETGNFLKMKSGWIHPTPIMTWRGNGKVGIGTDTPDEELHVVGDIKASGDVFASCGTLSCSDERFKKDFTPISDALDKVRQLNGLYYFWKKDGFPERGFDDNRQLGLIAQEVQTFFPEMVRTDGEGYLSVDYSRLTPVLVEAVKEQQTQIEELKMENGEWKAEIQNLQSQLSEMDELKNRMARLESALLGNPQSGTATED